MIKTLVLFLLPAALLASCSVTDETSSSNNEVIFADYQELPDPDPADEAAWDELDKPFYARFGSTDIRYAKSQVPEPSIQFNKKLIDTKLLDRKSTRLNSSH